MAQHADRLQHEIENQAKDIITLHNALATQEKEIESLKNPNYDQIFAYIDRQIQGVQGDTERKLAIKADKREMETVIPQRLEDLYRNMNSKYHDLKLEVAKTATKEDVLALAQAKVCFSWFN